MRGERRGERGVSERREKTAERRKESVKREERGVIERREETGDRRKEIGDRRGN